MADTLTKEELQTQVQEEVKETIVESMAVVKKYVDENSIENTVKRDALKEEIANAIAEKYDFEAEKEKLEKANGVAETLLGIFDSDGNGEVSPDEFLKKLDSVYAQLKSTNELSGKLDDLAAQVADLKPYIDEKIAEVNGSIKTVSDAQAKTEANLQVVEANLTTNYFTKEDVQAAVEIKKDEIVAAVNELFFPSTDSSDDGDGATV